MKAVHDVPAIRTALPNVNWSDDKLQVNWNDVDNRNDNLRSRVESRENPLLWRIFRFEIFEPAICHS